MEDAKNESRINGTILARAALAALALAMSAALAAALSGCGQSPEDLIRDGVEAELSELKAMEGAAWDDMLGSLAASSAGLAQYGVDGEELARALLEGFDYQVGEVRVSGSEATVEVETTCRSVAAATGLLVAKVEGLAAGSAEGVDASEVGGLLVEAVAEAPLETVTVTLPYVLDGRTWGPGEGYEAEVMRMLGL